MLYQYQIIRAIQLMQAGVGGGGEQRDVHLVRLGMQLFIRNELRVDKLFKYAFQIPLPGTSLLFAMY